MKLPVSKKFYSDICERISSSLAAYDTARVEAMRLIDDYLTGNTDSHSDDPMAMLAFNMVRTELDRAMVRSANARLRAKERADRREPQGTVTMSQSEMCDAMVEKYIAEHPRVTVNGQAASFPNSGYSRRERRHLKNTAKRVTKSKWKKL